MTTHETAPDQSRIWRRMMIAAGLVLAAEVMWMGLGHSSGVKTALLIPANPRPPSGPQFSITTVVAPTPTPAQQSGQSASQYLQVTSHLASQSAAAQHYLHELSDLAALAAVAPPAFGLLPIPAPPPAPMPVVPPPTTTTSTTTTTTTTTVPPTTTTTTVLPTTTTSAPPTTTTTVPPTTTTTSPPPTTTTTFPSVTTTT